MIGKIRKGRSFSGCIRYVTQKDDAKIIASEGVLLGTVEETARSFRWQCLLNPDVAKPVGHDCAQLQAGGRTEADRRVHGKAGGGIPGADGDTEHAVHRGEASRDGQPALPHRFQPGGLRRESDFRQQRFQAQRESDKNA